MKHMDVWPNKTLFSIKDPLMGATEVWWCVHFLWDENILLKILLKINDIHLTSKII